MSTRRPNAGQISLFEVAAATKDASRGPERTAANEAVAASTRQASQASQASQAEPAVGAGLAVRDALEAAAAHPEARDEARTDGESDDGTPDVTLESVLEALANGDRAVVVDEDAKATPRDAPPSTESLLALAFAAPPTHVGAVGPSSAVADRSAAVVLDDASAPNAAPLALVEPTPSSARNESPIAVVEPTSSSAREASPIAVVEPASSSAREASPIAVVEPASSSARNESPSAAVEPASSSAPEASPIAAVEREGGHRPRFHSARARGRAFVDSARGQLRRVPPVARWVALSCLVALLGFLLANRVGDAEEGAAAPSDEAAAPSAPVVPRVAAQGKLLLEKDGVRVSLRGAVGRFAHVIAFQRDGSFVRLYPFEAGEAVPVEAEGTLDGALELADPKALRVVAVVADRALPWSEVEAALRARGADGLSSLAGVELVALAP